VYLIQSIRIKANPYVKVFILSEVFLWSAWNLVIPIFSVFIVNTIKGGSIEKAAYGFSIYLLTRVLTELFSGKYFAKLSDTKKIHAIIVGNCVISLAFLFFAFTANILWIFIFYAFLGLGMGFAAPLKFSLFSRHLDLNKESSEWSVYDGLTFIGMAASASIGGYLAANFGFKTLFILSAIVNIFSSLPYIWYLKKGRYLQSN